MAKIWVVTDSLNNFCKGSNKTSYLGRHRRDLAPLELQPESLYQRLYPEQIAKMRKVYIKTSGMNNHTCQL